jgi:hypothetical protein
MFCGFNPAVSVSALRAMRVMIRKLNIWHQTQLSLDDIARKVNPLLRGWMQYYGRYALSALTPIFRYVNQRFVAWVMRKFKRFRHQRIRASQFVLRLSQKKADLFAHWRLGMTGVFT